MTNTGATITAAFSLACLALSAAGAYAQSPRACPHDEGQRDLIAATLKSAASCQTAYDLLNACRSNTSGDVALAGIVIERCEGTFLSGLAAAAKRKYEQDREACRRRYAKREGTMYVSFSATCEAGVAARYAGSAQTRSRGK
jgi:hypothetical protein